MFEHDRGFLRLSRLLGSFCLEKVRLILKLGYVNDTLQANRVSIVKGYHDNDRNSSALRLETLQDR